MTPPILITGIPRSGTSLTAKVFADCGAWVGTTLAPDKNQPAQGYMENQKLHMLARNLLRANGLNCRCGPPIVDPLSIPWTGRDKLRSAVIEAITEDGYTGGPWLFKTAHIALAWPLWHAAFPDAQWVVVYRRPKCVRDSVIHYGLVAAEQWPEYGASFSQIINDILVMVPGAISISSDRLVETRDAAVAVEMCGLKWNPAACDHIDPKYWHTEEDTA